MMKPFSDEACVKCGSYGPKLSYSVTMNVSGDTGLMLECLDATCWRCGFTWRMQTKDAHVPAPAFVVID